MGCLFSLISTTVTWLVTCLIVYIICGLTGLEFSWYIATAIWLGLMLMKFVLGLDAD